MSDIKKCKNCDKVRDEQYDKNICYNCGLETYDVEYSTYNFEEIRSSYPSNNSLKSNNSRISKIQQWNMWTSEESNEYKLNKYTREFCYNLNNLFSNMEYKIRLNEMIIEQVIIFVSQVMKAIKDDYNGPKRSKVKDSFIIMCIYYILKNNQIYSSYIDISKILKIEMKHISNANKTITHLLNNGKLKITDAFKNIIKIIYYIYVQLGGTTDISPSYLFGMEFFYLILIDNIHL